MKYECRVCLDGESIMDDVCPNCGRKVEDQRNTEEWKSSMYIPKYYRARTFNKGTLMGELSGSERANKYVDRLDQLFTDIKKGVLDKSYFIIAPPSSGKTVLAYSIISALHGTYGMDIPPILDMEQFKIENRRVALDSNDHILNKNYLVLKAKAIDYRFVMQTLDYVLDYRSRKDLPTLIISDKQINDLSEDNIIVEHTYISGENKLRYPVVINVKGDLDV